MLCLRCCTQAFSSCGELELLSDCNAQASHYSGFSYCRAQMASMHTGFSSCGVWAQLPQDMWNLPRPGIEPMFPELAGRLLTTGSPKKSLLESLLKKFSLGCSAHQIIQNDLSWKSSGFPGSSVGKESACNARDPGSIPRSGRSIGEG